MTPNIALTPLRALMVTAAPSDRPIVLRTVIARTTARVPGNDEVLERCFIIERYNATSLVGVKNGLHAPDGFIGCPCVINPSRGTLACSHG
jgi:hypothetical protein